MTIAYMMNWNDVIICSTDDVEIFINVGQSGLIQHYKAYLGHN